MRTAPGLKQPLIDLGPEIVGAEIGVWTGWNMADLLDNCPNISLLHGIDPYEPYMDWNAPVTGQMAWYAREAAVEALERFGSRANLIFKPSSRAYIEFDGYLDFVFIDGDHSHHQCYLDIAQWSMRVRRGGIVAGHDWSIPTVQSAVERFRLDWVKSPLNLVPNDVWYWVKD